MDSNVAIGILAASGFLLIIILALLVITIIANWKLFEKAGEPGWSAIVPFYSQYQMAKIATADARVCWTMVGVSVLNFVMSILSNSENAVIGGIATIVSLASLVVTCYVYFMFAKSYGQSTAMCILAILFGGIIFIIMAFNKNTEYVGPKGVSNNNSYNNYNSF